MHATTIIDQFLNVFTTYIDSGFGLLKPEVAFLTVTLTVIDMTLAALFWAMGGETDLVDRLARKTLYIGFFAFLLNDFNHLAGLIFKSFASLGLQAAGSSLSYSDFLQPGRIAQVIAIVKAGPVPPIEARQPRRPHQGGQTVDVEQHHEKRRGKRVRDGRLTPVAQRTDKHA